MRLISVSKVVSTITYSSIILGKSYQLSYFKSEFEVHPYLYIYKTTSLFIYIYIYIEPVKVYL